MPSPVTLFKFADNEEQDEVESRYYLDPPAPTEQTKLFKFEADGV